LSFNSIAQEAMIYGMSVPGLKVDYLVFCPSRMSVYLNMKENKVNECSMTCFYANKNDDNCSVVDSVYKFGKYTRY